MQKTKRLNRLILQCMRVGLLPVILISLSAVVYARPAEGQEITDKKITLSVNDTEIKIVLNQISRKTDVKFVYSAQKIPHRQKVSFSVENEKLGDVLIKLLYPFGIKYEVIGEKIILRKMQDIEIEENNVIQQNQLNEHKANFREIKGKVTDASGKPLASVSVTVKGTNTGTSTNSNGEFSIEAKNGDVLEFSIIGYKTVSVTVANQANIAITLEVEVAGLTDVVVVAYGRQKKISVTGSVASVSGKQLRQSPATNLSNSLAGRLPGLVATQRSGEPGYDGAGLQIRGVSTINDNSPLVIVDGIPGRSLSQINPNDVESISILKDASAAAYGARSANGVILVTTRRGSSGKTTFGYTGSYGWQIPTRLPEYVNSYDFARLNNQAAKNDNPIIGTPGGPSPPYSDDAIQKYKDGSDRDRYPNTNWIEETIRPSAPQTQHTLTMRGGGKQARFFASAGYFDQEGIWYGNATNFKRFNFTSNVDFEINSNFTGSLDLQGRQENRNFPGKGASEIFSHILRPGAIWPIRYSNGLLAGGYNDAGQNPLIESTKASGFADDKNNVLQTRLTLRHQLPFITKGLAIEGIFAYDKSYRHVKNWSTPYKYYRLNKTSGQFEERTTNGTSPNLSESYQDDRNTYGRFTLDYIRDFGDHDISALVLYEFEDYFYSRLSGSRKNFAIPLPYLQLGGNDDERTNSGSSREYGRKSYFGRINYSYAEKYLLELGLRADESANFPKGNRMGYFPAVSLGWITSSEPWFKVSFINNLKLRGSWSRRGNDILQAGDADNKIIRYEFLSLYNFNSSGYVLNDQVVATLSPGVLANPKITWEKAETINFGFDATVLSNRLTVSADAFVKKTSDILDTRLLSVPAYTGISLPKENLSKVTTKGFEAEATWRSRVSNVNYFITTNLAFAKSRIDFRDESPNVPEYQKITGHPVGAGLYYIAEGLFQSQDEIDKSPKQFGKLQPGDIKYRDVSGNNQVGPEDRIIVDKTQNPWTTFGFSFGADWKGLDFSVLFQGAVNSNLYLSEEAAFPFFNGGNLLQKWVGDSWTPDNKGASLPRLFLASSNNTQRSTFWLKNANYLRLKNIEIGFNMPESLINKWSITGLRFYVNALNMFTIDKIKTFDPEYPNGRGWTYPQQKVVNLGLNLQF